MEQSSPPVTFTRCLGTVLLPDRVPVSMVDDDGDICTRWLPQAPRRARIADDGRLVYYVTPQHWIIYESVRAFQDRRLPPPVHASEEPLSFSTHLSHLDQP